MEAIIPFSHQLLKETVHPGEVVIDATCGNGHDTLMLGKLVGKTGKVYGFDIQKQAIEQTKALLLKNNIQHAELIHKGHEHLSDYIDQTVAGAIFNLGYLPRGDHSIITTPDTTIQAIHSILPLLKKRGRVVIVIYYGHAGGMEEKESLLSYSKKLDQKHYQVLQYQFINQKNNPPFVLAIEKLK